MAPLEGRLGRAQLETARGLGSEGWWRGSGQRTPGKTWAWAAPTPAENHSYSRELSFPLGTVGKTSYWQKTRFKNIFSSAGRRGKLTGYSQQALTFLTTAVQACY